VPHRPSSALPAPTARTAPSALPTRPRRRRPAGPAAALAAVLALVALPAAAADEPSGARSGVVHRFTEAVDRTAGTTEMCLDDWDRFALFRWESHVGGSTWVYAHDLPEHAPGCHAVTWDLGTTQAEHGGRYFAVEWSDPPAAPTGPSAFEVLVDLAPAVVLTHPGDATVSAGDTAEFRAAVAPRPSNGPLPVARWQTSPDGVLWEDVPGATGDALALPTQVGQDGALVRAVYSRTPWHDHMLAPEEVATEPARLTVWTGVGLERAPRDAQAAAGEVVTFDVGQVWGVAPVALQWEHRAPGGDWEPVAGETGASLSLVAGAGVAVDGARFRLCHANDHSARACTPDAALGVLHPAPEVTLHPEPVTALPREPVEFVAGATGAESVHWESRAPGGEWELVPGTEGAGGTGSWALRAEADLDGTEYRAVFRRGDLETATDPALLTVRVLPPADVSVTAVVRLVDRLPGW
jgi:hypothetical protein